MASVMTAEKSDHIPEKFSPQTTEHRPVSLQSFPANHHVRFIKCTSVIKGGSQLPDYLIAPSVFSDLISK